MAYDVIFENKELIKLVYALFVSFICAIIVLKADRLFKLSDYQGLRYFRNAFFFYGLAFITRFIIGGYAGQIGFPKEIFMKVVNFFFEFFIIMAGFFLLYSLIWKEIEKEKNHHSFLNLRISIFYIIAVLISALDLFFKVGYSMYVLQIILFTILSTISYIKYSQNKSMARPLKYYFLIMVLGLVAWSLNLILYFLAGFREIIQINIYLLNSVFFLFFLYITTKIIRNKNG